MSLSMYQASTPGFIRGLNNLSVILDKAMANAESRKIDQTVLVNARLAPDMLPLARQIQIASDGVKGCAARLAGIEIPSFPDTEATFDELKERIAKTITFLNSVTVEQIDGSEEKTIELKTGGREITLSGRDYLFGFVIPNFYFHLTTAYGILRHNGVPLGKLDYLNGSKQA